MSTAAVQSSSHGLMFGNSAFDRFCQLEGALSRHYDASDHHVVWRLNEPSLANHGHVVARGRKHDLHRVARVAARPARARTERLSNVIGIGEARLSGFHGSFPFLTFRLQRACAAFVNAWGGSRVTRAAVLG